MERQRERYCSKITRQLSFNEALEEYFTEIIHSSPKTAEIIEPVAGRATHDESHAGG